MTREEIINKINKVKAMNLPHMNYVKLKEYYDEISGFEETEENIKIMDEYLNNYLDPKNEIFENGCWFCSNKDVYLYWGITHGIAHFNCCGLEYKCYHYSDDICEDKKLFNGRINIKLQYHPDGFVIKEIDE